MARSRTRMPALPFTITLGRPSRGEVAGVALLVGSATSWVTTTAQPARPVPAADPLPLTAPLEITSIPSGADVAIDGQPRGVTPATLAVVPGRHDVVIDAQDAIDQTRTLDVDSAGASLDVGRSEEHTSELQS